MTPLRPQIVAAASVSPVEQTAVGAMDRSLRRFAALALSILGLWVAASPAAASADRPASAMRVLEREVLANVNALRRQHGLVPLRLCSGLEAAAREHSTQMARRGYFGHSSAGGGPFDRRVSRFYPRDGRHYWSIGENLLWSSPDVDAAGALRAWVNSPEHRKNMLMAGWREIGLAAVHVASAPGAYGGREVTILTADFGVRR
jgi:uncharacterized protein YkwD